MQIGRTSCGIAVDMEEVLLLNRASTGSRLSIEPRFDGERAFSKRSRQGKSFLPSGSPPRIEGPYGQITPTCINVDKKDHINAILETSKDQNKMISASE